MASGRGNSPSCPPTRCPGRRVVPAARPLTSLSHRWRLAGRRVSVHRRRGEGAPRCQLNSHRKPATSDERDNNPLCFPSANVQAHSMSSPNSSLLLKTIISHNGLPLRSKSSERLCFAEDTPRLQACPLLTRDASQCALGTSRRRHCPHQVSLLRKPSRPRPARPPFLFSKLTRSFLERQH